MAASPNSPRKWRKSLLGFGINWPSKSPKSFAPPPQMDYCRQKRHNSVVTFAPSPPQSPPPSNSQNTEQNPQIQRQRGYSTQSCRAHHPLGLASSKFGHHHGSVQSLVIRQKIQRKSSMFVGTSILPSTAGGALSRRPSTPSLPMAIVQAVTGRLRQGSSTFSLDEEEDSAFFSGDSACSSASLSSSPGKRNSEISTTFSNESPPMAPHLMEWTEEDEEEMDKRFAQSIGHQFVKHYKKLAWANLPKKGDPKEQETDILCAQGNIQFHLLSLVAPSGKRVVNVGRPDLGSESGWLNISPSLRPYKPKIEINWE